MSKEGQLIRGKVYYELRDVNGNYPDHVLNNPNNKEDLDLYIESLPVKTPIKEVKKKEVK